MTEIRYAVETSHQGSGFVIQKFSGDRREKTVRADSSTRALKFRTVITCQQWDALAKSPEEAVENYKQDLFCRVETAQTELGVRKRALLDFEDSLILKPIPTIEDQDEPRRS